MESARIYELIILLQEKGLSDKVNSLKEEGLECTQIIDELLYELKEPLTSS